MNTAKIATFADGSTDAYKGVRDVKAAWKVTTPDGEVYSGHSLDRVKAEKTARATVSQRCPFGELKMTGVRGRKIVTAAAAAYYQDVARQAGFTDWKAYNVDAAARRSTWINGCKIEVVDL